jgi:hypothetical protein
MERPAMRAFFFFCQKSAEAIVGGDTEGPNMLAASEFKDRALQIAGGSMPKKRQRT